MVGIMKFKFGMIKKIKIPCFDAVIICNDAWYA